jgi:hypothetical protein
LLVSYLMSCSSLGSQRSIIILAIEVGDRSVIVEGQVKVACVFKCGQAIGKVRPSQGGVGGQGQVMGHHGFGTPVGLVNL